MTEWRLTRVHVGPTGEVRWQRLGRGRHPVVLLHGTPFSAYVWRAIARSPADSYQVYMWDMPGYGASQMSPGQDVSLAAQGRVFAGLLTAWGLREPLVVAHDIGGCVALRAHLLRGPATGRWRWSTRSRWHPGDRRSSA